MSGNMRIYENPQKTSENRLPPRSVYIPGGISRYQSLNGVWDFVYFERDVDVPEKIEAWGSIAVPSCWQLMGYGSPNYSNVNYPYPCDPPYVPDDNPCGVYRREFELPEKWGRVYFVFEGVASCAFLYLNGRYAGFTQGSHLQAEFDITDLVEQGRNTVEVRVLKWCCGSYLEDQDCFRYSGIFRDCYLLQRPAGHIGDVEMIPSEREITVKIQGTAAIRILDGEKVLVESVFADCFSYAPEAPVLWNAEKPHLYTVELERDGELITRKAGLRSISISGEYELLINGTPVKLHGVNHHDTGKYRGWCQSGEELRRDLTLMKELMYGVPIYVNSEDYIMQTWMANATLLKEQNIEIPATQDEFLEACRKIKANTDVTPLQRRYGLTSLMDSIGLMYKNGGDRGLTYNPDEKTWEFGPTKEGSELKAYLTFMHTLWEENLIDHEINTMSEDQYNDYIKSGRFAFTNDYITTFSNVTDYEPAVIPTPEGTGCKVAIDSARDAKCVWAAVSSKGTKHPELLAACIDLMFSDEIATLENYGIEGVTYELKDGEKDFLGNIRAASNNFTGTESLADYGANGNAWMRTFGVTDTNATRLLGESPVIYEGVNNIISLLDAKKQQPRYQYSYPTLTEDENSELSDITTPVTTYLDECMAKFIIGDMDLDADWDTFMTKLQGYGDMARACEILNSKEMATFSGNWR